MRRRSDHRLTRAAIAATIVISALLMTIGCPFHGAQSTTANTGPGSAAFATSQAQGVRPAYDTADVPGHDCCRDTPHATAILAHPPSVPTHPAAAPAEHAPLHGARPARPAPAIPDRPPQNPGALLPNAMTARR
jgi:hypothetical protein